MLPKKRNRLIQKKIKKSIAVIGIIFVEVVLSVFLWNSSKSVAKGGYIVKNGKFYVLMWKNTDQTLGIKNYSYLYEAIEFAKTELKLKTGANPNYSGTIEGVWEREDVGNHIVFWKTSELNVVHRLTFHRTTEAKLFANAFKRGGYSTSPYGHSLSLVTIQNP